MLSIIVIGIVLAGDYGDNEDNDLKAKGNVPSPDLANQDLETNNNTIVEPPYLPMIFTLTTLFPCFILR